LNLKIGVFGGTFNPLHNGHINIASGFMQKLGLDFVLLIPTYLPPHKSDEQVIIGEKRLEMCRLASEEYGFIKVSDIEIARKGKSYTVETLKILSEQYPDDHLFLLMGADMFLILKQWKDIDKISKLSALCAAPRHEGETERLEQYAESLKASYKAECYIENIPIMSVSSTQIREDIKSNKDISGLVPQRILNYIKNQGLYSGAL
jgi:nicotinate-nucleotide adenylyltransferase